MTRYKEIKIATVSLQIPPRGGGKRQEGEWERRDRGHTVGGKKQAVREVRVGGGGKSGRKEEKDFQSNTKASTYLAAMTAPKIIKNTVSCTKCVARTLHKTANRTHTQLVQSKDHTHMTEHLSQQITVHTLHKTANRTHTLLVQSKDHTHMTEHLSHQIIARTLHKIANRTQTLLVQSKNHIHMTEHLPHQIIAHTLHKTANRTHTLLLLVQSKDHTHVTEHLYHQFIVKLHTLKKIL